MSNIHVVLFLMFSVSCFVSLFLLILINRISSELDDTQFEQLRNYNKICVMADQLESLRDVGKPVEERVYSFLERHGAASYEVISRNCMITYGAAKAACNRLKNKDRVFIKRDPETGKAVVDISLNDYSYPVGA